MGPDEGVIRSSAKDAGAGENGPRVADDGQMPRFVPMEESQRIPTKITLDAYATSHRAVRELKSEGRLPRRVRVRSSKYLNNMIEQDNRRIKQRTRPMLGFKRFDNAAVTISGIELYRKFRSISLRPANWVAVQPQCRNFGTLCWPPDPKFQKSRRCTARVRTLNQSRRN
jgi:hypothetical protein